MEEGQVEKYQFKCKENPTCENMEEDVPKEYTKVNPPGLDMKDKRKLFFLPRHAHVSLFSSNYKNPVLMVSLTLSFDSSSSQGI